MVPLIPALAFARGLPWKAIGIAVAAAGIFVGGWTANGWRWSTRVSAMQAAYADATTKASEEAREREQTLADAFAIIDAERTAERTKADEEINRLRAGVDAGAVRLRVAAHCPPARLSEAAVGAGLGDGARAELAADARPDYFALRAGLTRVEAKLAACQGLLMEERR